MAPPTARMPIQEQEGGSGQRSRCSMRPSMGAGSQSAEPLYTIRNTATRWLTLTNYDLLLYENALVASVVPFRSNVEAVRRRKRAGERPGVRRTFTDRSLDDERVDAPAATSPDEIAAEDARGAIVRSDDVVAARLSKRMGVELSLEMARSSGRKFMWLGRGHGPARPGARCPRANAWLQGPRVARALAQAAQKAGAGYARVYGRRSNPHPQPRSTCRRSARKHGAGVTVSTVEVFRCCNRLQPRGDLGMAWITELCGSVERCIDEMRQHSPTPVGLAIGNESDSLVCGEQGAPLDREGAALLRGR